MNVEKVWRCPDCSWEQRAHPDYGWQKHDDRAVEVHQTMLCPSRFTPDKSNDT